MASGWTSPRRCPTGTSAPTVPEYLTGTINQPRWLIKVVPTEITTWQGVGWARRYWVEGTGGASYAEAHGG